MFQEGSPWDGSSPAPSSSNSQRRREATRIEDESRPSTREPINVVLQTPLSLVAFLADKQQFLSVDDDGMIQFWQVKDSLKEVGTPLNTGNRVCCLAASRNGKWIATGTHNKQVLVWDAETRQLTNKFKLSGWRTLQVDSVDISSDGTTIAMLSTRILPLPGTGVVETRSLRDGKKLWHRRFDVGFFGVAEFSPDGLFLAFTAFGLHILNNNDNGKSFCSLLLTPSRAISWTSDSKRLFTLTSHGHICCVDVYSKEIISEWAIHSDIIKEPRSVHVSSDGSFVAASANTRSVSFWDTRTQQQIAVVHHPSSIQHMEITQNYCLVIAGGSSIALWDLRGVLSAPYIVEHPGALFEGVETNIITEPRSQLANAQHSEQDEDASQETINALRADLEVQNARSMDLERTVEELRTRLADSQQVILAHRQKHECEAHFANGHIIDAAKSLIEIVKLINGDIESDTIIMNWLYGFRDKCVAALERIGDVASGANRDDEALAAYATALSLSPSGPNMFLKRWVSMMLLHGSTGDILDGAHELGLPKPVIYRAICDILEGDGRVTEAIRCFRRMKSELTQATDVGNERVQWELDFQHRCTKRLERLAETALGSQDYNEAVKNYSILLLLDPNRVDILLWRSKVKVVMRLWTDALKDADKAIELDPSSHLGFEQRYGILRRLKRHEEAHAAYNMMLSKLTVSSDLRAHELLSWHAKVANAIRDIIDDTTSRMPPILIDTTTGCLSDRPLQKKAFEALPIFTELMSSMTSEINGAVIRREVIKFCRYVMFSHKWKEPEPLFQEVGDVTVYKLRASPGNDKLREFCSLVRSFGFRWAWSDTCCIDKDNHVVLQESLVAMFAWYRGSSLTVIHLCDVSSEDEGPDGVRRSIWNTRAWTYQEYVAAKRVLFYTKDWKPYLGLTIENHKESPIIQREMEMSQVSSEQVAALEPGPDRVREKLYLASTRKTTRPEDIAYSLLGILKVSIPVIYGEGTTAVGRLLEYVLTRSGDTTILAWTGTANDHNSCLPLDLTVYETVVPPHIPQMETAELDLKVTESRSSLSDAPLEALYEALYNSPPPTVTSGRLQLPGIISAITNVRVLSQDTQTYRLSTDSLGDIDIQTTSGLMTAKGLCLVHPWIRPLLDQEFTRGSTRFDSATQALRMLVRLQQPFGALLFRQVSRTEYTRVAADSFISAQLHKEVSLGELINNIRTIEVL